METLSAMQGFIVIGIIIGIGYLAARANVGGPTAQMVLQRFAFFVATPCLMFTLISKKNWPTCSRLPWPSRSAAR